MVTLKEIETVLAVERTGSFRRAAQSLGIGQANVSKIIAHMEKKLDVQLFVRASSGAELTEEGEYVKGYAEQIEKLIGEIWKLSGK